MSSRIPQNFIDSLLARIDIVELIRSYDVPLRKTGASYSACCPFHSERTPSFHVSATKQLYHCFGCNAGGNAIHFLMEREKLDFIESLKRLAEHVGLEVPQTKARATEQMKYTSIYPLVESAATYFQNALRHSQVAIDYLKSRGISGQTAKRFRLGYAPQAWDGLYKHLFSQSDPKTLENTGLFVKKEKEGFYDRFRDRIIFPIRDMQGRVVAFGGRILHKGEPKYLNSPETPLFQKSKVLYGLYEAYQATDSLSTLWVVEGYMDLIALSQAGIFNIVATLGTAVTSTHLRQLLRLTSEIIFCFDGDKAGQKAAWRALETLLPLMQDDYQVRFALLPEGEDPDSYIRTVGKTGFLAMPSQTLPEFFFNTLLKGVDLGLSAGRAKLAKQVSNYLKQIPAKFLRQIMLDRLSHLTRIEVGRLEALMQTQEARPSLPEWGGGILRSSARVTKQKTPRRFSPIRLAIMLLLQHPHLVVEVEWPGVLENLQLKGLLILKELYHLIKEQPHLTTAMLIEHWRDREEERALRKLAIQLHWIPEAGILQELKGAFEQLKALGSEQKIEALLQEGQMRKLTLEEKLLLQELIQMKARAK